MTEPTELMKRMVQHDYTNAVARKAEAKKALERAQQDYSVVENRVQQIQETAAGWGMILE